MDFVSKVMSLHFNMLSRFVIVFLPRSNYRLISWLQAPSAVILEHKKIKSVTASTFFYLLKIFIFYKEHIFMICISLDILLSKKVIILKGSQFSHYLLLKFNRLIRVSIYKVIS